MSTVFVWCYRYLFVYIIYHTIYSMGKTGKRIRQSKKHMRKSRKRVKKMRIGGSPKITINGHTIMKMQSPLALLAQYTRFRMIRLKRYMH